LPVRQQVLGASDIYRSVSEGAEAFPEVPRLLELSRLAAAAYNFSIAFMESQPGTLAAPTNAVSGQLLHMQ
jgi:hypothetical protein